MTNSTKIVFVLQGLNDAMSNKHAYFTVALLVYIFTLLVNLTLIVTIILERTLHEPMFFFLCNLCVNGIIGACTFYPKILLDLSSYLRFTSYIACMSQGFLLYTYSFVEFTTLTVMAYDRYIAICKPLNYHSIVTPRKVVELLFFSWLFSLCETSIGLGLIVRLPLCGFIIDKLYCTAWAVVKLSCMDTTINNIYGTILSIFHFSQVVLILLSYINIVKASVKSQEGRNKFMQTCLPHLISLINFTASFLFDIMYARYGPTTRLHALRHFMSLEYLVFPPHPKSPHLWPENEPDPEENLSNWQ